MVARYDVNVEARRAPSVQPTSQILGNGFVTIWHQRQPAEWSCSVSWCSPSDMTKPAEFGIRSRRARFAVSRRWLAVSLSQGRDGSRLLSDTSIIPLMGIIVNNRRARAIA